MARYRLTESRLRDMIREAVKSALMESDDERSKALEIANIVVDEVKKRGYIINVSEDWLKDDVVKVIFDNNLWIYPSDRRFYNYMVSPQIERWTWDGSITPTR